MKTQFANAHFVGTGLEWYRRILVVPLFALVATPMTAQTVSLFLFGTGLMGFAVAMWKRLAKKGKGDQVFPFRRVLRPQVEKSLAGLPT